MSFIRPNLSTNIAKNHDYIITNIWSKYIILVFSATLSNQYILLKPVCLIDIRIHQGQLWANTARDKDYDNKLCFLLF